MAHQGRLFVGSNFPSDPTFIKEETNFNPNDAGNSANARHKRWLQLMAQSKGKIDAAMAQKFLADHFDAYTGKWGANERTLCGHIDVSPLGKLPSGAMVPIARKGPLAPRLPTVPCSAK